MGRYSFFWDFELEELVTHNKSAVERKVPGQVVGMADTVVLVAGKEVIELVVGMADIVVWAVDIEMPELVVGIAYIVVVAVDMVVVGP